MTAMMPPTYLQKALDYLDLWLGFQKESDPLTPGYAVAVGSGEDIVYEKAFGIADTRAQNPLRTNHLFYTASHSKMITATLILRLQEAGKLDIQDPAAKYLPFLTKNPDSRVHTVTIEQILSHCTGFAGNGTDARYWQGLRPFLSRAELEDFFITAPLTIESGVRFKYSNVAYTLLGWIIESLSDEPFMAYARRDILDPLGLSDMGFEDDLPLDLAAAHMPPTRAGMSAPFPAPFDLGGMSAAAGLKATPRALCRFCSAIMPGSGLLLSDSTKEKMLRKHRDVPQDDGHRSYGLGFARDRIGSRYLNGHIGGMPGHIGRTYFDPKDKISISILTNGQTGQPDRLQQGAWHILDFFKTNPDSRPHEETLFPAYAGTFRNFWETFHFLPMGNKIHASRPLSALPFQDMSEIAPDSEGTLRITRESGYASYGETVVLETDADGSPIVHYGGLVMHTPESYETLIRTIARESCAPLKKSVQSG